MSQNCKHHSILMSLLTVVTLIAVFLHMASHLIPVLLVSVSHEVMESILSNPIVTIAAWSFLPLMIWHILKDRKMHAEIHRLQEEIKELEEDSDCSSYP